jgi:hypothetical protein
MLRLWFNNGETMKTTLSITAHIIIAIMFFGHIFPEMLNGLNNIIEIWKN